MDKPWQRQPTTPASPAAPQNSCPQHRHRLPVPWDAGNVEHDTGLGQEQHFQQFVLFRWEPAAPRAANLPSHCPASSEASAG